MTPVSSHFLNLSLVDPQGFAVERTERERVDREQVEQAERRRVEEEEFYFWPRLQVRITGLRRLLSCIARQPAGKCTTGVGGECGGGIILQGRRGMGWCGGLRVWSKGVRCLVCQIWRCIARVKEKKKRKKTKKTKKKKEKKSPWMYKQTMGIGEVAIDQ